MIINLLFILDVLNNNGLTINCKNEIIQDNITQRKINLNVPTLLINLIVNNISIVFAIRLIRK